TGAAHLHPRRPRLRSTDCCVGKTWEVAMGTFGTGPFDSDAALDLLELLKEYPRAQRLEVLRRLFAAVLQDPDADRFQVAFPEYRRWFRRRQGFTDRLSSAEVVAGAILVVLALPGGKRVLDVPTERSLPFGGIPDLV